MTRPRTARALVPGIAALALVACSSAKEKGAPDTEEPEADKVAKADTESSTESSDPEPLPAGQWYRARLVFEGFGSLPFYLLLPEDSSEDAYLKNGEELVPVAYERDDAKLELSARWNYVSRIKAEEKASGELEGMWTRDFPLWGHVERDFHAQPVESPDPEGRFSSGAKEAVQLSGVWRFHFEEHGSGKGKLSQEGGVLRGYVRPGWLGDLRFLAGNVRGRKVFLSTFNGNSANLVRAEISEDGTRLTGEISMYNVWNEKFTAEKVEGDFEREDGVHLKEGETTVSAPILKKYQGKPVLLIFFATWCPSCNDATPFIVDLYDEYEDEGVEFVSLAYELSEDQEENRRQIRTFRKKYGVSWETKQVPTTPQEWPETMPPELAGWDGLPIFVFIRRDGTVHATYGGWYGPAAPEENEQVKARFKRWMAEIAES